MGLIPYVVRQGDYLLKLAHRYDFDADEIWNSPENKPLRDQGRNPEMLCTCDVLYFPEPKPKWFPLTMGSTNTFVSTAPTAKVNVKFAERGTPYSNEPYEIKGADLPAGSLDGDGALSIDVPVSVQSLIVRFPKRSQEYTICLGHLDPVEERSGIVQRLQNLGYLPANGSAIVSDGDLDLALRRFQRATGIDETGKVDDKTKSSLVDGHGR